MNRCVDRSSLQHTGVVKHTVAVVVLLLPVSVATAQDQDAGVEFFESRIRPLLSDHCFACHSADAETLQAGLSLDHRDGLTTGGDSGPAVVPGKPKDSLLIRAVRYEDSEMPPDQKLSDQEIEWLEHWVRMGAPWPAEAPAAVDHSGSDYDWERLRRDHWAFRPVQNPRIPEPSDLQWTQGPVDRFILARLESAGLTARQPAAPHVLARRIYLDLTGLLPTPEEVAAFRSAAAADRSVAVEQLVDRLLESPHYGERWGRHWLDVARFSDGLGGSTNPKPNTEAWRYRDWVISAFNQDMPYDRFLKLQIAGDLLEGRHGAVATGFFALGPIYSSDGGDPDSIAQAKGETLDDRIDTLSRGMLALTVSCARCHDHKFDPVPQQDYYSLAGVFNNTSVRETPLTAPDIVEEWDRQHGEIEELKKRISALEKKAKQEKRDLTDEERAQLDVWRTDRKQREESLPAKYAVAHTLHDTGEANMHVAIRGNLRKQGDEVPRQFLRILAGDDRTAFHSGSGRIQLAEAVAGSSNPLTARVLVNRVWMHHFGRALVRSADNFGTTGESPTHPHLLDWLASEFMRNGWSVKWLHRTIMTSASYQQSSVMDSTCFEADGDNRLVWRMNPRRMDVEVWRDSLLKVTGELDLTAGGPPFSDPAQTHRRTLYARVSRNGDQVVADGFLRLFDFPLMRATVARRPVSVVPQQFLFMLNSDFMADRAQALVKRLDATAGDPADWIRQASLLLYGRPPEPEETEAALEFLDQNSADDADSDDALPGLVQYAQVLLSSNEFMYVR